MHRSLTILIFVSLFFFQDLNGQDLEPAAARKQYEQFDKLYGLDQNLINGVLYRIEFPDVKGHPFLDEEHFIPGSIQIGEMWYMNVLLAYNVYNQEVVMKYENIFGGSEYIVLHNEFVEGFFLGLRKFEMLDNSVTGKQFFQVIDAGSLKCYYKWTKGINESVYPYSFWDANRKFYLLKDDLLVAFKSRAAFIRLFDERNRKSIRKHMKKSGIKLKFISDKEMMELLQYCY